MYKSWKQQIASIEARVVVIEKMVKMLTPNLFGLIVPYRTPHEMREACLNAYGLTDGVRSSTEIGKMVGTTQRTIVNWWERWRELGLATNSPYYQGRALALFNLTELKLAKARAEALKHDKDA